MKKRICYLLAIFSLISTGKAYSLDASVGGYDAGAFNRMEQSQINNFQLEKSYIHSLDHVSKDESIYDASVE